MAAALPETAARDIFGTPGCFVVSATGAVGTSPTVAGGYRLTGRWPFGSGAASRQPFHGAGCRARSKRGREPVLCCLHEARRCGDRG